MKPTSEDALALLIREAREAGKTVRVVGAGHSSSRLVETSGLLVSMEKLQNLESWDQVACEATLGAGITLDDAGGKLAKLGMAFANLGDVDYQTVAGAMGTGTHGTGVGLRTISAHLVGGRLVTGTGEIKPFAAARDLQFLQAARVSLGTIGILTALTLRLAPAYQLRKRTWCARVEDCVGNFAEIASKHRHVDFYWYPRSDETKIRTMDMIEDPPAELTFARLQTDETGWSHEVMPNARELRFEEMEYALPAEHGLACFQKVRLRIKERWRRHVGWRVLYRTVAADDGYLSPAHGRATATISLHQNNTLPFWDFFRDIEPIFREYGGRPHWGKKHSLEAADLRPLYPAWDRFLEIRQGVDPAGVFLNRYLRGLLGVDQERR
jgi:FAD/FMN-containing dehydrogenase